MSRRLFAFLLSELKTIRIVCKHCQGVTEMPLERVHSNFSSEACRSCQKNFGFSEFNNPLSQLAASICAIQTLQKSGTCSAEIEFVLPDNETK